MNGDQNDWRFQRTDVGSSYGGVDRAYNSTNALYHPTGTGAPQSSGNINAANRASSPATMSGMTPAAGSTPSLDLSTFASTSRFSLGSDSSSPVTSAADFYRSRLDNADLTPRDRKLYGAGDNFGFTTY